MKNKLLFVFVIFPLLIISQEEKLEVGFLIGNNGQLEKTIGDFYFPGSETAFLDDSYKNQTTALKYSFLISYKIANQVALRLNLGYSFRKDHYDRINDMENVTYDFKQNVYNISPSVSFSKPIEKFELSTGLEFPLFFVNDFKFNSHYINYTNDDITLDVIDYINMDGGFIWGINNFINLKYFLTKHLAFCSELKYGLLFAEIGDKYQQNSEYIVPDQAPVSSMFEKSYSKTFFSQPEISFGILMKL
jgi:hypothetical protein